MHTCSELAQKFWPLCPTLVMNTGDVIVCLKMMNVALQHVPWILKIYFNLLHLPAHLAAAFFYSGHPALHPPGHRRYTPMFKFVPDEFVFPRKYSTSKVQEQFSMIPGSGQSHWALSRAWPNCWDANSGFALRANTEPLTQNLNSIPVNQNQGGCRRPARRYGLVACAG